MPASDISVRELARAAGVSHAAPARHFGDRDGLITALTAACLAEFVDAQEAAVAGAAPGEQLTALGRAYVAFAQEHPHVFALVYTTRTPEAEQDGPLQEQAARHADLLGATIDEAVRAGRLPETTDPGHLALALWSLAHGLAHLTTAAFIDPDATDATLTALLRSP